MKYQFRCITCENTYDPQDVMYVCPVCEDRMGTLEVEYDYSKIQLKKSDFDKNASMWQFEKILPIKPDSYRTHLHVGGTPLYKFENLLGAKNLFIKYDGGNPTGSYKDRASAIAVTKALEFGYKTIYCASTGNAASSLAGIASVTPLESYIFVPSSAPEAKLAQQFIYGAKVIPLDGTYDEAFDLSIQVGEQKGWYCRNSAINPYLLEGKKTGALEIIVQNDFNVPEYVLVGVGDGTVISSIYKGFYDFKQLGLIDSIPKIIGVQAIGSCVVKRVYDNLAPYIPEYPTPTNTIADSISVGNPRDVIKACTYVEKSKGFFIDVNDDEIIEAIGEMAKTTGIFGEPAGAASYAGLKKLIKNGIIKDVESACIFVTGNGLKDIKVVQNALNIQVVKPEVKAIMEHIEGM